MADITLSSAVRSNLLSLQDTAALLESTQERLSTGLKVNSALDDATAFFTASSLNTRASDLNRLLDSVGNAVQTVTAADNGLSAITDLVESAQASARQALQTTGAVTTTAVTGATSAGFDPQATTSVVGTGSTLTADASATLEYAGNLGTDAANAVATGADIGNSADLLSAIGTPPANGDQLIIENGANTLTVNFTTTGAAALSSGNTVLTIGIDQTVAQLATGLNGLDGISATDTAGVLEITSAAEDTLRIRDGAGTPTADLGFGAVGIGAGATDRLVSKNTALDDLVNAGHTLTVQRGTDTATTVTFGTGAGQVQTKADLISQLNAAVGINATETGTNQLTLANSTTTDFDNSISVTTSDASVFTAVGITPDTGQTTQATIDPNNLLTQAGGLTAGQTLQVDFGTQSNTITFGTGTGQVSSLAELNTALNTITGGAASVGLTGASLGNISLSTTSASDTLVIGGTTSAIAEFGIAAGEFTNLINGTTGPVQQGDTLDITVGTNSTLSITFGTGVGQVNTLSELNTALSALAGGSASVDSQTGAINITATAGTDNIVIAEGNAREAAAFGLAAGTTTSTTTNSAQRTSLEDQFNDIRTQIDQLSRDASFNGNNLLQGDNLNVIFNEDGTSSLNIDGVTFNSAGLGINAAATGSFQTDANIDISLNELTNALATIRSQASTFGSQLSTVEIRQEFTKDLINTLETGAANLTLADTNEEGANLLALQTRQQLSSTALSLASQADQNVLRLFG